VGKRKEIETKPQEGREERDRITTLDRGNENLTGQRKRGT